MNFSPVQPATTKRFDRPELDILRLFAFLLVLDAHTMPGRWEAIFHLGSLGTFGVDLFFVLSAYLITELLRLEKERTGQVAIQRFYIRRVLRIWPLLFVFLFVVWLRGRISPSHFIPGRWIASLLFFYSNWYAARQGTFAPPPLGPLWSLSIEEQFYLLWPTLVARFSRRAAIAFCVCLFPVAWAAVFVLAYRRADPLVGIWTNSLVQFQMFAAGALLAFLLRGRQPTFGRVTRVVGFAAGLGLLYTAETWCAVFSTVDPLRLMGGYVCAVAGSCLLLLAALGVRTHRWMRPLCYLGKISYGLYVFHFACVWIAVKIVGPPDSFVHYAENVAVAFGLTVAIAAASFQFLEKPFILMKQRFEVVRSRTA